MKVFLIDDSAEVIERLMEMLAPLRGIEVTGHAARIPEALAALRATSPDVVLLDLHLSNGSGIEILQAIKKEIPGTIVIVLTNYTFAQYQRKCFEAGANAFLDKSTDFIKVPKVIQALANRKESQIPASSSKQDSESRSLTREKVGSR